MQKAGRAARPHSLRPGSLLVLRALFSELAPGESEAPEAGGYPNSFHIRTRSSTDRYPSDSYIFRAPSLSARTVSCIP